MPRYASAAPAAAARAPRLASAAPAAAARAPCHASGAVQPRLLAPHPLQNPARASVHPRWLLRLQRWWPLWVLLQECRRGGGRCPSTGWRQLQVPTYWQPSCCQLCPLCRPQHLPQRQRQRQRQQTQQQQQQQQRQPCQRRWCRRWWKLWCIKSRRPQLALHSGRPGAASGSAQLPHGSLVGGYASSLKQKGRGQGRRQHSRTRSSSRRKGSSLRRCSRSWGVDWHLGAQGRRRRSPLLVPRLSRHGRPAW